jgi:hypothetical protein
MTLLLFLVLGVVLGYWLGMGPWGFVAIAAVSIGAAAAQIGSLSLTNDRSWMTMLPLLVGATVVAGMLLGALLRRAFSARAAA